MNGCTSIVSHGKDVVNGIECFEGYQCRCRRATGGDANNVNSALCVYDSNGHFTKGSSFVKSFPMTEEIGHFFARDDCDFGGGTWRVESKECQCENDATAVVEEVRRRSPYHCGWETLVVEEEDIPLPVMISEDENITTTTTTGLANLPCGTEIKTNVAFNVFLGRKGTNIGVLISAPF